MTTSMSRKLSLLRLWNITLTTFNKQSTWSVRLSGIRNTWNKTLQSQNTLAITVNLMVLHQVLEASFQYSVPIFLKQTQLVLTQENALRKFLLNTRRFPTLSSKFWSRLPSQNLTCVAMRSYSLTLRLPIQKYSFSEASISSPST